MLRVNVGLSRKVSKDYNSTGYSVNLDGEITAPISDPEAVIEQVKELFDLAEEALNQQIERADSEVAIGSRDGKSESTATGQSNGHLVPQSNGNGDRRQNGHREDEPATNKQINYLLSIGKRQRLTTAQLEAKVADFLGRPVGLYDLTKRAAAGVIDALTSEGSAATASGQR